MINFLKTQCKLYVINLDRSIDRLASVTHELNRYNLEFTRVSAIEDKDCPACGCLKSHLKILNMHNEDKHCVIIEDDMFFDFKDPVEKIEEEILKLTDWDMIFPYCASDKKWNQHNSGGFYSGKTYGTHFCIINKKSVDKLVINISQLFNNNDIRKLDRLNIDRIYKKLYDDGIIKTFVNDKQYVCQNIEFKSEINGKKYLDNNIYNGMVKKKEKIYIDMLLVEPTNKCTLSCTECSKLVPYFKGKQLFEINLVNFEDHLKILTSFMSINCIRFEGGEPLLQKDLNDYVVVSKKYCNKVAITTNGTLNDRLTPQLIDSLDEIYISKYPNILDENKLKNLVYEVKNKNKKIEIMSRNWFVKVFSPEDTPNPNFKNCSQYKKCFSYVDGYFLLCSSAYYINLLKHNKVIDGIKINNENIIKIEDAINNDTELQACTNCYFHKHKKLKRHPDKEDWSQSSRDEWLQLKKITI